MSKVCVVSCPISTYSGYGARSRDLVKSLIRQYPNWDIKILAQRWGDTRRGYLEDHGEHELLSRVVPSIHERPDVWIQITVPNEFQPIGAFNIGITAGIETTVCDPSWIEGCNRMNLVLVSSNHGKASLVNSKYQKKETGEKLEVTTPVEVLFEGIDSTVFFRKQIDMESELLKEVDSTWNFLCVGHWLQGDFGQDRKNIGYTIRMFLETFKDQKDAPGLILKISRGIAALPDRYQLLEKIYTIRESVQFKKSLPKIYLVHGDLTDQEMNDLYNDPKVKCLVSFTKGEGYGRPIAEFASIGKPVLCSGWSGQMDFLDQQYAAFVGGKLEKIHPSAVVKGMILPEAMWFTPDDRSVVAGYESLFANYSFWQNRAKKQAKIINSQKSMNAMQNALAEIFSRYEIDGK